MALESIRKWGSLRQVFQKWAVKAEWNSRNKPSKFLPEEWRNASESTEMERISRCFSAVALQIGSSLGFVLWWIWATKIDGHRRAGTDGTFVRLSENGEPGRYWGSFTSFFLVLLSVAWIRTVLKTSEKGSQQPTQCCSYSPDPLICETWACCWAMRFRERWALSFVFSEISIISVSDVELAEAECCPSESWSFPHLS